MHTCRSSGMYELDYAEIEMSEEQSLFFLKKQKMWLIRSNIAIPLRTELITTN